MTAALELGRWVFLAPLGYINVPRAMGKSLMPDPERAPMVRRVFEAYATGRFTKQQVLGQARAWGLTNRRNRTLTSQAIGTLLRNRLYAGIVDVPEYGVRAKRGDFANRSRMSTVRSADWRRLGRSRTSDSTRSGSRGLRQGTRWQRERTTAGDSQCGDSGPRCDPPAWHSRRM